MDQIIRTAYRDEFQKIAGVISESLKETAHYGKNIATSPLKAMKGGLTFLAKQNAVGKVLTGGGSALGVAATLSEDKDEKGRKIGKAEKAGAIIGGLGGDIATLPAGLLPGLVFGLGGMAVGGRIGRKVDEALKDRRKEKTASSFADELQKLAAPRALKEIRKLIQAGDTAGAAAMAKRFQEAGALKVSGPGSQIKHLGSGSEGISTLVAGAKDAPGQLAVRKAYDPGSSTFSKQLLADRMNTGRKLNENPAFAKLYSRRLGRGASGGRYTLHEYVPGQNLSPEQFQAAKGRLGEMSEYGYQDIQKNRAALHDQFGDSASKVRQGFYIGDLNRGNLTQTARGMKVRDYMPYRQSAMEDMRANPIEARPVPPQFRGYAQRQAYAVESRALAGTNTAPSDFSVVTTPEGRRGLQRRQADPVRALQGLGPGSPRMTQPTSSAPVPLAKAASLKT